MRTNDSEYYTIYSYNMCLSFCDLCFIDVKKNSLRKKYPVANPIAYMMISNVSKSVILSPLLLRTIAFLILSANSELSPSVRKLRRALGLLFRHNCFKLVTYYRFGRSFPQTGQYLIGRMYRNSMPPSQPLSA